MKKPSYKPLSPARKQKISEGLKAFHLAKKKAKHAKQAALAFPSAHTEAQEELNRFYRARLESQKKPEKTIFSEAEEIIYGDREKTYGKPSQNLQTIAGFWQNFLDHKNRYRSETLTPEDVCIMMILLKVSRQMNSHNRDSLVDICGYAGLIDRVNSELSFAALEQRVAEEIEGRR